MPAAHAVSSRKINVVAQLRAVAETGQLAILCPTFRTSAVDSSYSADPKVELPTLRRDADEWKKKNIALDL